MMSERDHCVRAFAIGAVGYSLIELLARRHTHWTMAVTGGLCFMLMHKICRKHKARTWQFKCLVAAGLVTSVEFLVGILVNRVMKWAVWDYSDRYMNLLGQICPRFSVYWFLLGLPIIALSNALARRCDQA